MMIWRGLSPKAILACLDYLLPGRVAKTADGKVKPDRKSESKQRIDQATIEIESRL